MSALAAFVLRLASAAAFCAVFPTARRPWTQTRNRAHEEVPFDMERAADAYEDPTP